MKFDKTVPVKIVMLGAGGTGGHIAPHLYRLLYSLESQTGSVRPVRFIIADGDVVEEKNLVRQNFIRADLGENKAKVLAERYSTVFGLETEYIPEFMENPDRLLELVTPTTWTKNFYQVQQSELLNGTWQNSPNRFVTEQVILIGAVDNNRSRAMCHEVFGKVHAGLVYIDSGNGEHTGQVVCGVRRGGRTYFKPVGGLYPDVLEQTDKFPTELSCAEASVSAPQSIVANVMAATAVVNFVYNILVLGDLNVRHITFSTGSINLKPAINKKRRKKAA